MSDRPLRKRTPIRNVMRTEPVIDESVFTANRCSMNARKSVVINHNLGVELWFDKHYHDRHYHGDDNGKREGIDPATVESLVTRAIGYLFLYSACVKGFKFVNHSDATEPAGRIVLQEAYNGSMLNVVIEVHFVSVNYFEVTVKTGMVVDNFRIAAGQYVLELQGDNSFLRKQDNGKILEVCDF